MEVFKHPLSCATGYTLNVYIYYIYIDTGLGTDKNLIVDIRVYFE